MQHETSEITSMLFDSHSKIQALAWAAETMRIANPDNPIALSAYESANRLYFNHISRRGAIALQSPEADNILLTLQHWVNAGEPPHTGEITDSARAESYKTACAIVSKIARAPNL